MKFIFLINFLFLFNFLNAQQIDNVDFVSCTADLLIQPLQKKVVGNCSYVFKVFKQTDSVFIDAKQMSFSNLHLAQKKVKYRVTDDKLWFFGNFKEGKQYTLSFEYSAYPKKAMYFIDWNYNDIENSKINKQVWTQGQGKNNSNWIPCFDDVNEKLVFNMSISFDKNYKVISNGKLVAIEKRNNILNTWKYSMQNPMSSYLLAVVIGNYKKVKEISRNGIPLEMYYYPIDSNLIESTYRYSKKIFDFIEKEIGVKYPWQNYKQVPVKDFLYAGMENTSVTIFSDSFVIDSTAFVDRNYINVNAHELAHQWFGDYVTAKSGKHHWLQEGFATYYALLAEKEIFGSDYFYYKLYESSKKILRAQETDTIPLLNPKASSLTFYQKGAWALYALKQKVGNENFKKAVKLYLLSNKYANVETSDFLNTVELISKQNLSDFKQKWLFSNKFDITLSNDVLKKINKKSVYYELTNLKYTDTDFVWNIKNKNIKLRQELAKKNSKILIKDKQDYESLLSDQSYQTIETALLNLWLNFPEDRKRYLEQTKDVIGFNDKNVKILWLALSLNTKGFTKNEYFSYYKELVDYTSPIFNFETRRNAFQYLKELNLYNFEALENLKKGTEHHNWRFKSYCKETYQNLLE